MLAPDRAPDVDDLELTFAVRLLARQKRFAFVHLGSGSQGRIRSDLRNAGRGWKPVRTPGARERFRATIQTDEVSR
jgi:hypothetical protein